MTEHIPIFQLVMDPLAQPRAEIDHGIVSEYAQIMKGPAGTALFPPVRVFADPEDGLYYVGDGFHRILAASAADMKLVKCIIRTSSPGEGLRDAVIYSCGANHDHGKRRTNEDKRRAVRTLLADEEWCQWSDSRIAEKCRVSQPFVGTMRHEIAHQTGVEPPKERKVIRAGAEMTMRPGGGRPRKSEDSKKPKKSPLETLIQSMNSWWSKVQGIEIPEDRRKSIERHFELLLAELHTTKNELQGRLRER